MNGIPCGELLIGELFILSKNTVVLQILYRGERRTFCGSEERQKRLPFCGEGYLYRNRTIQRRYETWDKEFFWASP